MRCHRAADAGKVACEALSIEIAIPNASSYSAFIASTWYFGYQASKGRGVLVDHSGRAISGPDRACTAAFCASDFIASG